ncbi:hypothetical protein DUNSADRAFT_6312 [Dunaliella salina]|uniref:Uncharacterized protein n=1 Tax=Dunaliella salina TaxID=3046 RepID=A0ABQ7GNG1_DUNSA|nr:hypothetical protein DUNSADRAFT_6312 [Dunaliella salina]|eukprot:KAF5836160.1 hypothetical protein DUNSADRAFT_6312 [Dunaliella salina]
MYLQGFKGTRGLMELVAAEVYRSPALMSVCDPAAAAAAAAAQQHQLQQGGASSISPDLNDPSSTHMVSHQMPGMHVAVPPPRSLADRQKLARQNQTLQEAYLEHNQTPEKFKYMTTSDDSENLSVRAVDHASQ